uniref:G-protein coupled receptors family 1 profile domain-containing protein n=1 Tax=Romanomermis culicivorax TaxID=13658 RepID=A0A915K8X7_ROMCU
MVIFLHIDTDTRALIMNNNQIKDFNESSTYSASFVSQLTTNEKILAIIVYSTISVLSMIGNGVILFSILYFKRLRTPTNFLIGNLAVADLLMATICIPFSYWPFLIISYWPFGYLPCKLINFAQAAAVLGGAYTFVALSLDRFVAIIFPLKPSYKLTKRRALLWIVCIWSAALVIVSPLLAVLTLTDEQDGPQCNEKWGGQREGAGDGGYVYSIALMILQYFLPLLVFVLSYALIGLKLWYGEVPGENNVNLNRLRQDSVKKVRSGRELSVTPAHKS